MTDPQAQPAADAPQVIHDPRCNECGARVPDIRCHTTRPLGEGGERLPRLQSYLCKKCGHHWKVIRK